MSGGLPSNEYGRLYVKKHWPVKALLNHVQSKVVHGNRPNSCKHGEKDVKTMMM